ncbi:MAG: hypothetical protein MR936_14950 [Eubacterium sp.]|nr:hypothetical protein [Eubacterium sp.]
MLKIIILKWKIRRIADALRKCDEKTQTESILQIKHVLRNFCSDNSERKRFIDLVYEKFRESRLV